MSDHIDGISLPAHSLPGPWGAVESKLQGVPNETLTLLLLMSAGVLVWIALQAPATLKAATGAYIWLP